MIEQFVDSYDIEIFVSVFVFTILAFLYLGVSSDMAEIKNAELKDELRNQ